MVVEVAPPRVVAVLPPLVYGCLFSVRPASQRLLGWDDDDDRKIMVAHVVGDKFGGMQWIVEGQGFLGVGRNPCRFVRHQHGDARGRRPSFLNGVGRTPSPLPSVYREKF
jgi:hypothetical protein